MHQYKELIDDIDIKYIEMPNKLEWVILGSELYVNSKFCLLYTSDAADE